MKKIKKALFPVAGFGTRLLPITKAQPKEMINIVDKPVIQYLVEEVVSSGIEEIIVITSKGKRCIEDHFDLAFELEQKLEYQNKKEILKSVKALSRMAKFIYIRQQEALGDGHAVLCAKELVKDEPFAILFGDDLVDNKKPAIKQLIEAYEKTSSSILALEKIEYKDTEKYGIVKPNKQKQKDKRLHLIDTFIEKPKPKNAPSNLGVVGKYIASENMIKALEKVKPIKNGEIRLLDGFSILRKTENVYGYEVEGTRYDAGDKLGLLKANVGYGLKHNEIGEDFKKYLKSLVLD